MNDVNLNRPDLKLVRSSEQAPARASASPQVESGKSSAQAMVSPANRLASAHPSGVPLLQRAEKLERDNETHREELGEAVSQLNDYIQAVQRELRFEVDNELGQTIVRVVDQETQQVIRQIPDEVALRLAENLQQDEPLTLFNIKV